MSALVIEAERQQPLMADSPQLIGEQATVLVSDVHGCGRPLGG